MLPDCKRRRHPSGAGARRLCDHYFVTTFAGSIAGAAALAAAVLAAGCGGRAGADAMAAAVPAGARAVAAVDLDRLRASSLYPKLPASVLAAVEPLGRVSRLLLVYDGRELLAVARGPFGDAPPAGMTRIGRDLAAGGGADAVRAALAQSHAGRSGAPELVERATAALGRTNAIGVAALGGTSVPSTAGQLANLSGLLRMSEYATLSLRINAALDATATAVCPNPAAAARLEETLRAMASITAAGVARRQPELAALFRSLDVGRDGRTVHARASASPRAAGELLGLAARSGPD